MNLKRILVIIFIFNIQYIFTQESANITELNYNSLVNGIRSTETLPIIMVVLFYSKMCIHCIIFMPTYITVADYFAKEQTYPLLFYKIDILENPQVQNEFSIQQTPTLKYYIKGEPSNINSQDEVTITNYLKNVSDNYQQTTSMAEINEKNKSLKINGQISFDYFSTQIMNKNVDNIDSYIANKLF